MKTKIVQYFARIAGLLLSCTSLDLWACGEGSLNLTILPNFGGAVFQVNALNSAGQMTGFAYTADNLEFHAYLLGSDNIADLGTLGGSFSYGTAINTSGVIAGQSDLSFGSETHAFISAGNGLVDLGTLGGWFSTATAINDGGVVVGNSLTAGDAAMHAFVYANAMMTDLGTLGGSSSSAVAINQSGSVAGDSFTAEDWESHAFLYTAGNMTDLGTLGGDYSAAFALNDGDVVVGESSLASGEWHAFAYQGGIMQDLGTLGGSYSTASAINTNNQIIGEASTAGDSETHGFIYQSGVMTDLGTLGGVSSTPHAINNLGQVVGGSRTSERRFHAFLWQEGTMTDLNTLLPPGSGWELTSAYFINDNGTIVGYGYLNGVFQWFALKPGSSPNRPPNAVVSGNQTVDCGTVVTVNGSGSNDPDNDSLTYEWSEGGNVLGTNSTISATFGLGVHTIILKVTDACGEYSQASTLVMVNDQIAPTITNASLPITVAAGIDCNGATPNVASSIVASDNCTPANELTVSQNPTAGTPLVKGQHTVTVTVVDASGNSATTSVVVNVVDVTAPVVTSVTATPNILYPPNNQLVPVAVAVTATDNCDPAPTSHIISITANGSVAPGDIQITGDLTAKLAASKNTSGLERVYTILIRCTDSSGNSSTNSVNVTVPKSNGNGVNKSAL